jgi:hypothetical protein
MPSAVNRGTLLNAELRKPIDKPRHESLYLSNVITQRQICDDHEAARRRPRRRTEQYVEEADNEPAK